jgi:cullin-4
MFTDVDISRSLVIAFQESKYAKASRKFDLSVTVCQDSVWPSFQGRFPMQEEYAIKVSKLKKSQNAFFNLPSELSSALDSFSQFYTHQHSGRILKWQYELGNVTLKAFYGKEFVLSLPQALVLLAFNEDSLLEEECTLNFASIHQRTGIEYSELKRVLQSLACGKIRVLIKNSSNSAQPYISSEIKESDAFSLATTIESAKYRIRIPQIIPKETQDAIDSTTHSKVREDRDMSIDAAIVRVLKTKKAVSHKSLFAEVLEQCRFPIEVHQKCHLFETFNVFIQVALFLRV